MKSRISKSYTKGDWLQIRDQLKDKEIVDDNWEKAIKLIRERVSERYLEPLEILVTKQNYSAVMGFTIATIECCLIEFLAALFEGRIYSKTKPIGFDQIYYDDSAIIYSRFLRTNDYFKSYFGASKGSKPKFRPDDFYKNVRCALIHEAQTKSDWEIRIYGNSNVNDLKNKKLLEIDQNNKKVIYRTAIYNALKDCFVDYCDRLLLEKSSRGRSRRKLLARKIDYIVELAPDKSKYWWK